MEPIAIVKKRSRIWLIMAVLIIALLLIAAALWFMGDAPTSDFTGVWNHLGGSDVPTSATATTGTR
jgi:hypothetical protein